MLISLSRQLISEECVLRQVKPEESIRTLEGMSLIKELIVIFHSQTNWFFFNYFYTTDFSAFNFFPQAY